MYCVRVFLLIFLIIFTAAAACSSFFPLMRNDDDQKNTLYTWATTQKTTLQYRSLIWHSWRYNCNTTKTYYLVISVLSAVGFGLGVISALITAGFTGFHRKNYCCGGVIFIFTFLAFACYVVCFALVVTMFTRDDKCKETLDTVRRAYKDDGYKLVEGFGLMVAACGGFLICALLSLCA